MNLKLRFQVNTTSTHQYFNTTKKMTYENALDKLQALISSIENEEVSVDELSKKVKEANELIQFCRTKLRKVEGEIEDLE